MEDEKKQDEPIYVQIINSDALGAEIAKQAFIPLALIIARCKALGWEWDTFWAAAYAVARIDCTPPVEGIYTAAEHILSLHEDGLMVEIPSDDCRGCPIGSRVCGMSVKEYMKEPKPDDMYPAAFVMKPGPNCVPGKFKLVRWGK